MAPTRSVSSHLLAMAAPALLLVCAVVAPAAAERTTAPSTRRVAERPVLTPLVADSICRESPRAWHRASGDTLWLYYRADRATARVDTQGVVFYVGDSAVQLRPRPRRIGPTQAERLWDKHQACVAEQKRPPRR